MSDLKKYCLNTVWIGFLMGLFFNVQAGEEVYTNSIRSHKLIAGTSFEVKDPRYQDINFSTWKVNFQEVDLENYVELRFLDHKILEDQADFSVRVEVSIEVYRDKSGGEMRKENITRTLELNYKQEGSYSSKKRFNLFPIGHRMKCTVNKVEVFTGSYSAELPVVLEAGIQMKRYYSLDQQPFYKIVSGYDDESGSVELIWEHVEGAESYELEWTYVDNFSGKTGILKYLLPDQIRLDKQIFKQNATRVSVTRNTYKIPVLYAEGYILYRLRGVGRHLEGDFSQLKYGSWSSEKFMRNPECQTLACFDHKHNVTSAMAQNGKMNWISSSTFVDEGKHNGSISFSDGMSRGRQSVTTIPGKEDVSVYEAIYDRQGRQAVTVLPVPAGQAKIEYMPNFNRPEGAVRNYGAEDFDVVNEEDPCTPLPAVKMDVSSGASRYYSPNNPAVSTSGTNQDNYIPDAKGYPFVRTEFSNDGKNRVMKQSGLGDVLKEGGGKEYSWKYERPSQEELFALFGTDVGNAKHYYKVIEKDPNGQHSVQYLDPNGRVIATALQGDAPPNLEAVYSELEGMSKRVDVFEGGRTSTDDKLYYRSGFGVTKNQEAFYKFDLHFQGAKQDIACETDGSDLGCNECVYDIKVRLQNERCEDNLLLNDGEDLNEQVGSIDNTCGPEGKSYHKTEWSTSERLTEGQYIALAEVQLDEAALDYYTDQYIREHASCLKPQAQFLEDQTEEYEVDLCNFNCEECEKLMQQQLDRGEVDPDLAVICEKLCEALSGNMVMNTKTLSLLGDVSPGGQYGEYLVYPDRPSDPGMPGVSVPGTYDGEVDPAQFPLSVFHVNNELPPRFIRFGGGEEELVSETHWKHPFNPDYEGSKRANYLSESGELAFVLVKFQGGSPTDGFDYEPAVVSTAAGDLIPHQDDLYWVKPTNLRRVEDFIRLWQDSWAQSLLVYHPEYGHYQYYQAYLSNDAISSRGISSLAFDDFFRNSDTPEDFVALYTKYADGPPAYVQDVLEHPEAFDPFFLQTATEFVELKDLMKEKLETYLTVTKEGEPDVTYSMLELAYLIGICPEYAGLAVSVLDGTSSCGSSCLEGVDLTSITLDEQTWKVYYALYYAAKQRLQLLHQLKYSMDHNNACYNGCMGDEEFTPFKDGFFFMNMSSAEIRDLCELTGKKSWFPGFGGQYFNVMQPCSFGSFKHYEDKVPRFLMNSNLEDALGIDRSYSCLDMEDLEAGGDQLGDQGLMQLQNPTFNCAEEDLALSQATLKRVELEFFNECGLCPMARGLNFLLKEVPAKDGLTNPEFSLTCPEDDEFRYAGLPTTFIDAIPGQGEVKWKVSNWSSHQALEILLERDVYSPIDEQTSIHLYYENGSPAFDFNAIDSICCLDVHNAIVLPSSAGSVPPGHKFECVGIRRSADADGNEVLTYETLKGFVSTISLDDCTFGYTSEVTPTGNALFGLFNALLYKDEHHPRVFNSISVPLQDVDYSGLDFCSSSLDLSTQPFPYGDFMSPTLIEAMGLVGDKSKWRWGRKDASASDLLSNGLEMQAWVYHEDYVSSPGPTLPGGSFYEHGFGFTKDGLDYHWNDIVQFVKIQPDPERDIAENGTAGLKNGMYTNYFMLTALIHKSGEYEYREIKVRAPEHLNIGVSLDATSNLGLTLGE